MRFINNTIFPKVNEEIVVSLALCISREIKLLLYRMNTVQKRMKLIINSTNIFFLVKMASILKQYP